jgi:hypothetical protein
VVGFGFGNPPGSSTQAEALEVVVLEELFEKKDVMTVIALISTKAPIVNAVIISPLREFLI